MLVTIAKPDFIFENEAGSLKQLVHEGWKQINVITSVANAVRGNHYHKFNQEGFYVVKGSFKLELRKDTVHEIYTFRTGDMFFIAPYVFHTFEYLEDTILVSMYSDGVELSETEKDIWTK